MSEIDELKQELKDLKLEIDATILREKIWHEEYDKKCEQQRRLIETLQNLKINIKVLVEEKTNIMNAIDYWHEEDSEKSEIHRAIILQAINNLGEYSGVYSSSR